MVNVWFETVTIASIAAIVIGLKCLINYQLLQSRLRRDESVKFPWRYHVTGRLRLPFDDIVEPFEAWFAPDINCSRIDYYNGMDKTIQRGDLGQYGEMFKIVPMHSEISPSSSVYTGCWYKASSKWLNRKPQTVVPNNLSEFQISGEIITHNGQQCYKFIKRKNEYNKTNTYILYITVPAPHKPLRFEMIGYDELMLSHYDHYILDYSMFEPWTLNKTIFNVPNKLTCRKRQRVSLTYLLNPMAEFLHFNHSNDKELEKSYHNYKKTHKKRFRTAKEHETRKHIYKHNLRFIHSKNRQHLKYVLKSNHLMDLTDEEVKIKNGLFHEPTTKKHLLFNLSKAMDKLPENLDWRDYGAVSKVHSQGTCGSCWAFSTLGAVEAMNFLKTGKLIELSKQQLLDCSWGVGNHGCKGGFQARTLRWIQRNGISTKNEYGKYLAQEGYCHCGTGINCTSVHIEGFMHVKKHNPILLKIALATHGPIASSVNTDLKTFRFYSRGIYDDEQCKRYTNHAALTVGYGNEMGISYWVIKNSWGPLWGDNGYIKIATKNDICGTTSGSLIAIKKSKDMEEFPFKHLQKIH